MKLLSDLMTTNVVTLNPADTLADAEQQMKEHQIRHIPVVDDNGTVMGLLSQKEFLAEALRITDKFGVQHLRDYLKKIKIEQIMRTELPLFNGNTPLIDAAETLLSKRESCLLLVDEQQRLLGIVSSKDFVRLAIKLLSAE